LKRKLREVGSLCTVGDKASLLPFEPTSPRALFAIVGLHMNKSGRAISRRGRTIRRKTKSPANLPGDRKHWKVLKHPHQSGWTHFASVHFLTRMQCPKIRILKPPAHLSDMRKQRFCPVFHRGKGPARCGPTRGEWWTTRAGPDHPLAREE
jgi:hypothetical protein